MKNVVIRNMYGVGMHHYGHKELEIGPVYYCKPEKSNPYDPNAVPLYDNREYKNILAYLRREDARFVSKLFDGGFVSGLCYARAKGKIERFSKRTGPMQNISIGFKCINSEENNLRIVLQASGDMAAQVGARKRLQYHPDQMALAIQMVKDGLLSKKAAAKAYGVPKTTLLDKLSGRVPEAPTRPGPKTVLTQAEERVLVDYAKLMAEIGYPLSRKQFCSEVKTILDQDGRPNPFLNNLPQKDWFSGFCKRNPGISIRTPMSLGHERAIVNIDMIKAWYNGLFSYLEKEIPGYESMVKNPRRIFNADESGFPLQMKTGKVLAPTGAKNVYHVVSNTKVQITVMAGFNAFGEYVPPMILYPGERFRDVGLDGFPEATFAHTSNGWMDSPAFVEYLKTLVTFAQGKCIQFPILLIVDGHSTHMSLEAAEYCRDHQVVLYCLLPNATHILQACDIGFFSPMKSVWKAMVKEWQFQHVGEVLTKKQFPSVFKKAWNQVANLENASNAFRRSGLFPLSVSGIDTTKLGPSKMTIESPTTSSAAPSSKLSTDTIADELPMNPDVIEAPEITLSTESPASVHESSEDTMVTQETLRTQNNLSSTPLKQMDTNTIGNDTNYINIKFKTSGARFDHSYVSPAFSSLHVPEPKVRKQKDTLRSKLPKAISGTVAIQMLKEKKQKKEEEEIAKQKRKEERELKKRLKIEDMERKKQERELKRKEREETKKQKEIMKQRRKQNGKRKLSDSESSDDNNENVPYVETDSDAEFEEVCPGCYTSIGGRFQWIGCEACPSWWHINCVDGGALSDMSQEERKSLLFICPHCQ